MQRPWAQSVRERLPSWGLKKLILDEGSCFKDPALGSPESSWVRSLPPGAAVLWGTVPKTLGESRVSRARAGRCGGHGKSHTLSWGGV